MENRLFISVKDTAGMPIPAATISVVDNDGAGILFYAADEHGKLNITFPENVNDSLFLKVTSLGYNAKTIPLKRDVSVYNIILQPNIASLKEVVVVSKNNRPRVKKQGDTLNFAVKDFASITDRSIGDVIARLPGIQIDENGVIKYNGLPISNLFIDGDNVADGRYKTISENVKAGMIDTIQILENNQPVKLLQGIKIPDNAAINITLKKQLKIQTINTLDIGAGVNNIYSGELTNILLKKKTKSISTLKTNNTGNNLVYETSDFTAANRLDFESNITREKLLSAGNISTPQIPEKRWLFNQSRLVSTNTLFKISKDAAIRLGSSFFNDLQTQSYESAFSLFLQNDTVSYKENKRSTTGISNASFTLNYNLNSKNKYINNIAELTMNNEKTRANLVTQNQQLNVLLKQQTLSLSNSFSFLSKTKSSNIFEFKSSFFYSPSTESLAVNPGIFAGFLNNNQPYTSLQQKVLLPQTIFFNAASIVFPNHFISQKYTVKASFQSKNLLSDLIKSNNNNVPESAGQSYINNVRWRKLNSSAEAEYFFETNRSRFEVNPTLELVYLNYGSSALAPFQKNNYIFFNTNARLIQKVGKENDFKLLYRYKNNIGDVTEIYPNNILTNYRTIISNVASVRKRSNQQVSAVFNFKKSIKLLFISTTVSYGVITQNQLSFLDFSDSLLVKKTITLSNNNYSKSAEVNISKYLFFIKTNLQLWGSYNNRKLNEFQNGKLWNIMNNDINYQIQLRKKVNQIADVTYEFSGVKSITKSALQENNNKGNKASVLFNNHTLSAGIKPNTLWQIKLNATKTIIKQPNANTIAFLFADVSTNFSFPRKKLTIEAECVNITGVKSYQRINFNANSIFFSSYQMRPRFFIIRFMFSL
ncbi:MAG: hypothetical protein K2X48_17700 [Chitinophagaceae bacterium]|nr:hypothetical protein [Chitinophagaceae bacterium]